MDTWMINVLIAQNTVFLLGYELVTPHLTLDDSYIRAFREKEKSMIP